MPQGDADQFGSVLLDRGVATRIGDDMMTQPYAVVNEWRRVVRCGVNPTDVITTHLGYDMFLSAPVPFFDRAGSEPLPGHDKGRLFQMSYAGTTETWVEDIAWDGTEWIAVGHLSDFEISMDAVIWRSADGAIWDQGEVIAGGPGNQIAYTVTVRNGEIIVGGIDGQNATIWKLPV